MSRTRSRSSDFGPSYVRPPNPLNERYFRVTTEPTKEYLVGVSIEPRLVRPFTGRRLSQRLRAMHAQEELRPCQRFG